MSFEKKKYSEALNIKSVHSKVFESSLHHLVFGAVDDTVSLIKIKTFLQWRLYKADLYICVGPKPILCARLTNMRVRVGGESLTVKTWSSTLSQMSLRNKPWLNEIHLALIGLGFTFFFLRKTDGKFYLIYSNRLMLSLMLLRSDIHISSERSHTAD